MVDTQLDVLSKGSCGNFEFLVRLFISRLERLFLSVQICR